MKYLLFIIITLTSVIAVNAQIKLQSYLDIGENNVSEGVFIKNVYRGSYQYQKYNIEAGMQFDIHSNNPNTLTGLDVIGSRKFLTASFPFDIRGFFILNRFSDIMYETDWGLRIDTRKFDHFLFELGTNFKSYRINSTGRDEYNINKPNSSLHENFTLLYVITAYLRPQNNDWNIGLSITNVDYYIINQSTNPVFNLQMTCKLKPNLAIYLDSWYKQAGILNINANYFGYFFRGGVKWAI